ncbi:MAG: DUF1343 domain-containing protein [Candidatus Nitronauta litoralis]|uniref:DUF1343 domain-containing protein n=1 Tax=Candidatus Nitronauta litoralis TaxID=2705533 RepID=A0A7T0BTM7_9BACT|nr:MAG: DUF1343 domain-containing protein [Candidatus Nitronauta litoralis]
MPQVKTGLEQLLARPDQYLKNKRFGLLANQTSVTPDLTPSTRLLYDLPIGELVKLFAPEHGFYGVAQDMEHVTHETDPATGLSIFSLYGEDEGSLTPDAALFDGLDAVIYDIQDIGSRYYTFVYTLANCMQTAGKAGVEVIVLDRPNPINGIQLEGNIVQDGFFSFVGQYPLLTRHGMTAGELAVMFRDHFKIDCELTILQMEGWQRSMWFDETGLPWVFPSPNMPTLDTATVYPGMCLFEGTLLSEGRGTTKPFEQIGAPGIDGFTLAETLNKVDLPGIKFQPCKFKPKFQKHGGLVCSGVFLHVTDRNKFQPWVTGLVMIETFARLFPEEFKWRTERYEYVTDRPAIDLLYGNSGFREWIDNGQPLDSNPNQHDEAEIKIFKDHREQSLLYQVVRP